MASMNLISWLITASTVLYNNAIIVTGFFQRIYGFRSALAHGSFDLDAAILKST